MPTITKPEEIKEIGNSTLATFVGVCEECGHIRELDIKGPLWEDIPEAFPESERQKISENLVVKCPEPPYGCGSARTYDSKKIDTEAKKYSHLH